MTRKFPKPRLAVATLVAALMALGGGYTLLVKPQRQEAAKLSAQIADANAQLEEAQAPGGPQQDLAPIRVADLFQLSRAMPDRPDAPDVLLQLSQIADETGITFKSITPDAPAVVGSYQKLPIDLVFQGHFYDLSDFLYRLRNLVGVHDGELDAIGRLFSVDSITFNEGATTFPQVEASLRVDAYVFGDGTSSTPAQVPASSGAGFDSSAAPVTPSQPTSTSPEPPAAIPSVAGSSAGAAPSTAPATPSQPTSTGPQPPAVLPSASEGPAGAPPRAVPATPGGAPGNSSRPSAAVPSAPGSGARVTPPATPAPPRQPTATGAKPPASAPSVSGSAPGALP